MMQTTTFDEMAGERVARGTLPFADLADVGTARLPVMRLKMLTHVADVRGYFAAEETLPAAPAHQAGMLAQEIFERGVTRRVSGRRMAGGKEVKGVGGDTP
jgi:hypothetical protein